MSEVKRLDALLFERGYFESRTKASEMIRVGAVRVDGRTVTKPSFLTDEGSVILFDEAFKQKYVSRGGLKLEEAIAVFNIDVMGKICIDIGASTGGFTDCLLKKGAERVYAVDSGSSQLHESLKSNKKVISMENRNARYLTDKDIGEKCDIAVMDVSFISQSKLYQAVSSVLKDGGELISLIKPQFEVGRQGIGKGGIVKDEKKRIKAVNDLKELALCFGLECIGTALSPIKGGDGNTEYLAYFKYKAKKEVSCEY